MVKKVAKKKTVTKKPGKVKVSKVKKVAPKKTKKFPEPKKVAGVERPKPKGVSNEAERRLSSPRERRADGTFLKDAPHGNRSDVKVDKHFKSFDLKQAFLETFQMLGGVEELANWAAWSNANQTEFYKMLAKMLPREVGLSSGDIEPNKLSGMEDKELDAIINRHLTRS